MTLRLNDEEQAALKAMSEQEGLSQHEVARRAILDRAERAGVIESVQTSGMRVVTRYAALLDRLSQ
ncbi:MAG: ribbon-helix-helix domain-containing protein [Actinomycetota bacterium]|nr:ribbon-helix-helix domain-containing protein [Actinomycetota bacterium]